MDPEATPTTPEEVVAPAEATAPVDAVQEGPADSGFEDGHKLPDGSVVRHDFDDNGKYIGWHKEPSNEEVQI